MGEEIAGGGEAQAGTPLPCRTWWISLASYQSLVNTGPSPLYHYYQKKMTDWFPAFLTEGRMRTTIV